MFINHFLSFVFKSRRLIDQQILKLEKAYRLLGKHKIWSGNKLNCTNFYLFLSAINVM